MAKEIQNLAVLGGFLAAVLMQDDFADRLKKHFQVRLTWKIFPNGKNGACRHTRKTSN